MPLYEYECKKCGSRFEELSRADDEVGLSCPDCGASAERVVSGFSVARSSSEAAPKSTRCFTGG